MSPTLPPDRRARTPRALFDAIARRYDLANSVLSAGLHRRWKREAVALAGLRPGERVLDAGTGTGDLAQLAAERGAVVAAVDVSLEMLAVAGAKYGASARTETAPEVQIALAAAGRMALAAGDLEALPFRSGAFQVVLTGFTLRHPTALDQALREFRRVLAPGGRLVILEFAHPPSPLVRALYTLYSRLMIPALGGWLTGDADAYRHLVESIRRFITEEELAARLRAAGFSDVHYRHWTGGIIAVYTASAPR